MTRLINTNDSLARLQTRLARLDVENQKLRKEIDRLLCRVEAAEGAARASNDAYQELLKSKRPQRNTNASGDDNA